MEWLVCVYMCGGGGGGKKALGFTEVGVESPALSLVLRFVGECLLLTKH